MQVGEGGGGGGGGREGDGGRGRARRCRGFREGRVGGWLGEVIPPPRKHSVDFEAWTECCITGALIGAGLTGLF